MKTLIILSFFCLPFGYASAQMTYTEYLRNNNTGEGKITIIQSEKIENIINNVRRSPSPKEEKPESLSLQPEVHKERHEELLEKFRNGIEKGVQPEKMQGFRVQVYAGPKNTGLTEARKVEEKCKEVLPGISTYVRFIQPRWTCRIGDFQTREDAQLFMNKLQEANVSSQMTIVKCEIFKVY